MDLIRAIYLSLLLLATYAASPTRIAFGSCAYPHRSTKIFKTILERNPDLFIWGGDATYLDYKNYDSADEANLLYINFFGIDPPPASEWSHTWNITKNDKNVHNLLTGVPNIGVWDDHDFGLNDGDGINNAENKDYAQKLFLNFLNVPQNDPKREQKGLYSHYPMEISLTSETNKKIKKTIDIILLDTRYWARVDGDDNLLGNIQWSWLEDIIQNKAVNNELTVILSSIQFGPVSRKKDNWGYYWLSQQERLYNLLIQHNQNKRVILVSGDIHRAEILKTQCVNQLNGEKQNIWEVTSSGLTHAHGDIEAYIIRLKDTFSDWTLYDGIYTCRYWGRNFGEINIDWEWNNNLNDFEVSDISSSVFDINGNEKCSLDLPLWSDNDDVDDINYDKNGFYLSNFNDYKCFGGVRQYTADEVDSVSLKKLVFNTLCFGNLVIFVIYIISRMCIGTCKCMDWCNSCTNWCDKKKQD